jgi:tetratricopeptide (TPR) repeat protein
VNEGRAPTSSRVRKLRRTALGAVLFVAAAAVLVWWLTRPSERYIPGEAVEGLTSSLARGLPDDVPDLRLTDVTAEAGISFRHFHGVRSSQLPEDMGSGAAWVDYDRDGWPDLYLVNESGPLDATEEERVASPARAHLYRNRGDGTFEEVAEAAGVAFRGMGMGAAWGDPDNDGWPDLVVTAYGTPRLYKNQGDGTFVDRTSDAGFDAFPGFWTGAVWGDYDRDGRLDLYVTGYVRYDPSVAGRTSSQYDTSVPSSLNPSSFAPERNLLFRNLGGGRFEEVAAAAGADDPQGRGLSATWVDLDEDGWPDLYVANDVSDNVLLRNRGDGTFSNESHPSLVADYRGAMGIAVGDWDGDADLDMFITHWVAQENALYSSLLNQLSTPEDVAPRRMQFRDDADRFGLGQIALSFVGFGTSFVDLDNDGRLDLFVVNGSTLQRDDQPELLVPQVDQVYWNGGRQRGFFEVGPVAGPYFQRELVGRGGALADFDRDGDPDLVIVNHGDGAVLLRNDTPGGHWLQVELEGVLSNRSGIGAMVDVFADTLRWKQFTGAQSSYLSQHEPALHFGLGGQDAVDSVVVRWPDGERQRWGEMATDHRVRLVEGSDAPVGATPIPSDPRRRTAAFWTTYRAAGQARLDGELQRARVGYEAALALNPDHQDAYYYLGLVAADLGQFVTAENAWRSLVEQAPSNGRAHAELGRLYLCTEPGAPTDPVRARREFEAAHAIYPEQIGSLVDLALAELALGDAAAAEVHISDVLGTDAGYAPALYLQGYLAFLEGDLEEATRFYGLATAGQDEGGRAPERASEEGDTKGTGPMTVSRRRCGGLPEAWDRARSGEVVDLTASYRELQELLRRVRAAG